MTGFQHRYFGVLIVALLAACQETTSTPTPTLAAEVNTPDTAVAPETLGADDDRTWVMDGLSGAYKDAGTDTPVVLIVPGSGAMDRDGNSVQGISTNMYRNLAEGLAENGVSSLRVDKRGMYESAAAGDPNAVTVDIYAQDYRDWATRLRQDTEQDCVYLLGHSEGGLMISAAAAGNSEGVCGLILVAAPGRTYANLLRAQLNANPANAPILPDAMTTIARLENGEPVDVSAFHPVLQGMFAPQIQDFLISTFPVDPVSLLRTADRPTLIVQGDNDLQVSVEDAELLVAAGGQLVILPSVNHVLVTAPTDRTGNFATYANPDLPLAEGIVSTVVDFIKK